MRVESEKESGGGDVGGGVGYGRVGWSKDDGRRGLWNRTAIILPRRCDGVLVCHTRWKFLKIGIWKMESRVRSGGIAGNMMNDELQVRRMRLDEVALRMQWELQAKEDRALYIAFEESVEEERAGMAIRVEDEE